VTLLTMFFLDTGVKSLLISYWQAD